MRDASSTGPRRGARGHVDSRGASNSLSVSNLARTYLGFRPTERMFSRRDWEKVRLASSQLGRAATVERGIVPIQCLGERDLELHTTLLSLVRHLVFVAQVLPPRDPRRTAQFQWLI